MRALTATIGLALSGMPAMTATSTSAHPVQPPPEVACYLNAVNAHDLGRLSGCFAKDATVVDVSRHIRGRTAIAAWARAEVISGRIELLSVSTSPDGVQHCLVHWAPAGESGWRARYTFTLRDGHIVLADLQYA